MLEQFNLQVYNNTHMQCRCNDNSFSSWVRYNFNELTENNPGCVNLQRILTTMYACSGTKQLCRSRSH